MSQKSTAHSFTRIVQISIPIRTNTRFGRVKDMNRDGITIPIRTNTRFGRVKDMNRDERSAFPSELTRVLAV
eukprot:2876186-Pyramimonas_sp.AAC.1